MKEFIVKLGSPELNKDKQVSVLQIFRVHMLRYTEISQRVGLGLGHIISLKLI